MVNAQPDGDDYPDLNEFRSKAERLDAAMKEFYGCTAKELIHRAYQRGFEDGTEQGRNLERAAANRKKNRRRYPEHEDTKPSRAPRKGRPAGLDELSQALLLKIVDGRPEGVTVGAWIRRFQSSFRRTLFNYHPKLTDMPILKLTPHELQRAYFNLRTALRTGRKELHWGGSLEVVLPARKT